MLLQEDEITWQSIIHGLVSSGELDPWDIDISILTKKYVETIKKLQSLNFFISGKILLASAILLRMKSEKLITEWIVAFDNILYPSSAEDQESYGGPKRITLNEKPMLTIKTPQLRKKRVNIGDLISALEKALEVNERRTLRRITRDRVPEDLKIPERKIDISKLIKDLYDKMLDLFKNTEKLKFSALVMSEKKEDKIITFIPLLYLDTQEKVVLTQERPFGEIEIELKKKI